MVAINCRIINRHLYENNAMKLFLKIIGRGIPVINDKIFWAIHTDTESTENEKIIRLISSNSFSELV